MSEKIKLPIIVGPTASGKSALAMALAEEIGGEIVSCDSMQIYRRMNIGTAKPTDEEMRRVRHHMIDIVEPWDNFSCADYAAECGWNRTHAGGCADNEMDALPTGEWLLCTGRNGRRSRAGRKGTHAHGGSGGRRPSRN